MTDLLQQFPSPRIPYFDLYIGERGSAVPISLIDYPSTDRVRTSGLFVSMDYKQKATGGGNSLTLTIHDKEWDTVEKLLFQNKTQIEFEFGYRGVKDRLSKRMSAFITNIIPEYTIHGGATLTLSAIDTGIVETNAQAVSRAWKPSDVGGVALTVSRIVEKIAREHGFVPDVETTTGALDGNQALQQNISDLGFIRKAMLPLAKDANGKNNFSLWFDTDGKGVTTLHFKQINFMAAPDRTYLIGRGLESEVISFKPSFDNYYAYLIGALGVTAISPPDPLKDPAQGANIAKASPDTKDVTTAPKSVQPPPGATKTDKQSEVKDSRQNPTGQKGDAAFAEVSGKLKAAGSLVGKGELVVLGDPSIEPLSLINIVQLKSSYGRDGGFLSPKEEVRIADLAPTSGIYMVLEVDHVIDSSGDFKTTLHLFRAGSFTGGVPLPGSLRRGKNEPDKPKDSRMLTPTSI